MVTLTCEATRPAKVVDVEQAWLFCWTELGAKQVGIVQSLLTSCHLHDINPYDYLVDVLQRVGQHPSARVAELTPRLWKEHFAASPACARTSITSPSKPQDTPLSYRPVDLVKLTS